VEGRSGPPRATVSLVPVGGCAWETSRWGTGWPSPGRSPSRFVPWNGRTLEWRCSDSSSATGATWCISRCATPPRPRRTAPSHPAGVNKWLRELGIYGQRSHEKRIPREAFRLSNRQIALLLRHLWATDGSITVRPSNRGSSSVYFSTSSERLAEDVAALLLRLGIVSRSYTAHKPGYRPCFMVQVKGSQDQRRFLNSVGSFGPRVPHARLLADHLAGVRANTNVDTVPREVGDQIRQVMRDRDISRAQMARMRGVSKTGTHLAFKFAPSRDLVAEYADLLDSEALWDVATSDLFWDRVTSVTPAEEEDVYDLTVPGPASWLADAVTCHNSGSLEQDADVVMFIHREDVYNDDPSVKGVADVVVAKHRNGPIDKVRMTFLSHLTQFKDYSAAT
jgi:replicative DNA helicase